MGGANWQKLNAYKVRMYRSGLGRDGIIEDEHYNSLKSEVYESKDYDYITQLRCISKWHKSRYKEFTITNLAIDIPKSGTQTIEKQCLGCSKIINIKLRSKKSQVNIRNSYIIFLVSLFIIFEFTRSNPFGNLLTLSLVILIFGGVGFFFIYPEQITLKKIKFKSHEIMLPQNIDDFV